MTEVESIARAVWPWCPTEGAPHGPFPHSLPWNGGPAIAATKDEKAICRDIARAVLKAREHG